MAAVYDDVAVFAFVAVVNVADAGDDDDRFPVRVYDVNADAAVVAGDVAVVVVDADVASSLLCALFVAVVVPSLETLVAGAYYAWTMSIRWVVAAVLFVQHHSQRLRNVAVVEHLL